MKYSIVVVCLNPGEKLNETLDSILGQTYSDIEIIVKDGGSKDGSIESMRQDGRIHLYNEKDSSIYDAMNQAVAHATGDFVLFMNCGDFFYDREVLSKVNEQVEAAISRGVDVTNAVFYGSTYGEKNDVVIEAAPAITGFTCYRNIPCHQACVYATKLCKNKPYDLSYKIRADYDHFLWCFYQAKATMVNLNMIVASYEGDGFSENKANQNRDKEEHKAIVASYMSKAELLKYRTMMLLTLAPLRKAMAESKVFAGVYHKMKQVLYRK